MKTLTNYLGLTASNVSNTLKLHDIIAQNDVLLHIEPPQYFILWGRRAGGGGGGFLKKVLNYHINLNKIGSGGIAPNKKKILGNSSDGENKRFMVGNGNLNLNILFYV